MRVVHINKSATAGGAAIAAYRLVSSLRQANVDATMLVSTAPAGMERVEPVVKTKIEAARLNFYFAMDIGHFIFRGRNHAARFAFSTANHGFNLSAHPLVLEADIIHLHWFNHGFLSLPGLRNLLSLGKPVVWTLHDMWCFTGGCHYAGDCEGFKSSCGNCPLVKNSSSTDLSAKQHFFKSKIYGQSLFHVVTCSNWLANKARESSLAGQMSITSIPNPIDVNLFKPLPRIEARKALKINSEKKVLLFGAANVTDPRKGFSYLLNALDDLSKQTRAHEVELLIFGKGAGKFTGNLPFKARIMEFVNSPGTLVNIYNAADLFVLPSLEDNLPNTVMESLACGTPVVAFSSGGIPEMVANGVNGYLSPPREVKGLLHGIESILFNSNAEQLRSRARDIVLDSYSPGIISLKYKNLYESMLGYR